MSVPTEKKVPMFERFLEKNPFIKTIDLNRRKQLMKTYKTKKNTNDFNSHLSKLYSHFQVQSKSNEPIIQETLEEKTEVSKNDTLNNSFFQIAETNVEDLKESEISEKFFQKIRYDDREVWDSYNPREAEIKKQIANFQAKIFILEKKTLDLKKKNQDLEDQNQVYEEQVRSLMIDKNKTDKVFLFYLFLIKKSIFNIFTIL